MRLHFTSPESRGAHSRLRVILLALLAVGAQFVVSQAPPKQAPNKENVYDFSLVDQDGKVVPLANYRGKVLLIVNLASQSVYSSQIAALDDLQKTYGPEGLVILGIPSPDFGNEELKDPVAMHKYYEETAHADFPVFASATVTGVQAIPLFQYLCDPKDSVPGGSLRWNFTKFLIGRDGEPLARYEVAVDPADLDFHLAIESALDGKFKKHPTAERASSEWDDSPDE